MHVANIGVIREVVREGPIVRGKKRQGESVRCELMEDSLSDGDQRKSMRK